MITKLDELYFFLLWINEVLLSRKLHKDGDGNDDNEVKDGEFVHLLAHMRFPALSTATRI